MPTYTYPAMPLLANVWFATPALPPTAPPDGLDVRLSLSPAKPQDVSLARLVTELYRFWSHIIRTAPDTRYTDNYLRGDESDALPCTVFEVPPGSGHFYVALWCHVVGAGFPNEHARIYVARHNLGDNAERPWFPGWI